MPIDGKLFRMTLLLFVEVCFGAKLLFYGSKTAALEGEPYVFTCIAFDAANYKGRIAFQKDNTEKAFLVQTGNRCITFGKPNRAYLPVCTEAGRGSDSYVKKYELKLNISYVDFSKWKCTNVENGLYSNSYKLINQNDIKAARTEVVCLRGSMSRIKTKLICKISGQIIYGIGFWHPNETLQVAQCNSNNSKCQVFRQGYQVIIDLPTLITLVIVNFTPEADAGLWKCADGSLSMGSTCNFILRGADYVKLSASKSQYILTGLISLLAVICVALACITFRLIRKRGRKKTEHHFKIGQKQEEEAGKNDEKIID